MNIVKAYCRGFKNSLRHPKMIMLIFGITLILGLSLALPFFFSFKSAVGNSMVSKNLDYTTFTELIHFHSWNLDSITSQAKFTILIFWLLMIFFVGGIVRTFNKEDFSVSTFFAGAGVNFFRFLLCDVIMIVAQVITALLLFGIASFVLSLFNNVVTETPLFWAYGVSAFIFACAIVLWLIISDYAKFYMEMENTSRVFKAIGKATSFVFSNFVKTYFLYALLLVIPILTLVLYKLTFDKIGMATAFGIIAMFFVQQMFIILRIWYRIWSLSSQFELYADDYVKVISYDLESNGQHLEVDAVETEDNVEEKNTDTKVTTITTTTTTETTETTIKNEESTDDNSLSKNAVASDIIVVNEEGDTFNPVATTDTTENDAESKSESNTETKTEVTVTTITTETTETTETTSTDDTSKSDTAYSDEPDDVDTELLEHFYAGESEKASEQTSETESKVEETSETESKVEEVSESEPEDNEMTQFYAADQDDSIYESNLAKLDLEEEAEKQSEKQSEISSDNNVKDDAVVDTNTDTDAESKNDSVAIEVTTNIEPSNSESENNTDNESDNKSDSKIVLEVDSNTEVALEENTETTDNEKSEETEPDDIDEELLAQFYGNEESDMHETDSDPIEVVDIDDVDESVGSAVSLDVEDEDDDVVVTTTTTTTTTTTVVTEETVNDDNQPKIIKIYSEQEMRDIAKEQQENAGFKPDVEFTEIVSEDEEDGVVSGEQHSEEEFVQKNLQDGDDFNNPDSDALG